MKRRLGTGIDASRSGGDVVFRTAYSEEYDLIQIFRGMQCSDTERNDPVDFRLAGLQRRGNCDIWHIERALAFSTDECSPMVINDEDIGGNHGHPCGVAVIAPAHGKDLRDVGSLWQDDAGFRWTLLRVDSADRLLFISDNVGASVERYAFRNEVSGSLRYMENGLHGDAICPASQMGGMQLTPAIRHVCREALAYRDGAWHPLGSVDGAERAEIREVYDIINPATVAEAIRQGRPAEGYPCQPSLATGEAMMRHRMVYRIAADGTVLCDFDHELCQDVPMAEYLGIMYQEKCDAFGGGVWRCIPGTLPFEDGGHTYDFSQPVCITGGAFPRAHRLTVEDWADPLQPPRRQLDMLRDTQGQTPVVFAAGFLPVEDGAPEKRRTQIDSACTIVSSRKTYPNFAGGYTNFLRHCGKNGTQPRTFPRLRGVAYKKYFLPEEEGSTVYTIALGGKVYLAMDFFAEEPVTRLWQLEEGCTAQLLESAGIQTMAQTKDSLQVTAKQGFAVFCLQQEKE